MSDKPLKAKHLDRAKNIYTLFALGAACIFTNFTFLIVFGYIAIIFGIFMAYSGRRQTEDAMLFSHYRWQIRTFWIGALVVWPLALLFNLILLYQLTDINVMFETAASGEYGTDMMRLQQMYIEYEQQNALTLLGVRLATYGLALLWWLSRCWTGYKNLTDGQPAPLKEQADKGKA